VADLEATRQIGKAICVSKTPDFCKSPSAPVGYNIIAEFSESIRTASTVRMTQCRAFTSNSRIATVKGDEPGIGGGVKSGVNLGFCKPIKEWSSTVKTEGHFTCRHDTLMEMNCAGPDGPGNTVGKVIYVECYSCANVTPAGEVKVDRRRDAESRSSESSPQDSSTEDSQGGNKSDAPNEQPATPASPSNSTPPASPLEQQAHDLRNAGTELANQATAVKNAASEAIDNAVQSAKNIYKNPGIVLDNAERIGNQVGDYVGSRYNDPNLLLNDAKAVGSSIGSELQQMGQDLGDGIANNQPLTALAKVGPKLFGMVSGAVGAAKLAAGATKVIAKGGKATVQTAREMKSKVGKRNTGTGKSASNGVKVTLLRRLINRQEARAWLKKHFPRRPGESLAKYEKRIDKHMSSIDWNKPVYLVELPEGTLLGKQQYVGKVDPYATMSGNQGAGNYLTEIGADPMNSAIRVPGRSEGVVAISQPTQAIQATIADWPINSGEFVTSGIGGTGGNLQYIVPDGATSFQGFGPH
jgi:hypothetical protein